MLMTRVVENGIENRTNGTFTATISSETVDEYDSVIRQAGLDLDRFRANPVVLFGHEHNSVPIGRAVRVSRHLLEEPRRTTAEIAFGRSDRAQLVADAVKEQLLRGVSIGFRPLETEEPTKAELANGARVAYSQTRLLEISIVALPANTDAVIERRRDYEGLAFRLDRAGAHETATHIRTAISASRARPVSMSSSDTQELYSTLTKWSRGIRRQLNKGKTPDMRSSGAELNELLRVCRETRRALG